MFRSLFFRRLYVPYVLVVCAVALVVGTLGALRLHDAHVAQAKEVLQRTVYLVTDLLQIETGGTGNPAQLQRDVQALGKRLGYRITIIGSDPAGTVLADSEADPATMEGHRYRHEIVQAYSTGEGSDIRSSATIHQYLLYYAQKVNVGDRTVFVRLAVHMNALEHSLRTFYMSLTVATLSCIVLAAIVAYYVARRQAIPIVEVTGFADAVAKGDLGHRIIRTDRGELGLLAQSLNSMADSFARLLSEAEKDEAELRTILTSMSEGVIAADAQRKILLVNDAAARLLNFPADTAAGKHIWELIRNEPVIKAVDEVATLGQRRQFQIGPQNGKHLEIVVCPLTPASGARPGLIVVVHDISQAMRYQDLRKEFVANVSHELRTPLTVIKGYVETLRDGAAKDPRKCDEYLGTIERHTNQLTNLVNDLLEISKLESQTAVPRRSAVDLNALARRAADLLKPAAQTKGHVLELCLPAVAPVVVGNTDYLERAVINLLDNAIKYTPSNSNGKITLRIRTEDSQAVVEVQDNGIGIPDEDLPRIFERFYRVDRSRSREMGGTGLGLAIVKHIVQSHGGSVKVESHLNSGSTFSITLPLSQQQ